MHDTPDARDLVSALLALDLVACFRFDAAHGGLDLFDQAGLVLEACFVKQGGFLVNGLLVWMPIRKGAEDRFELLDELAHRLVRLRRQEGKLQDGDGDQDEQVEQEHATVGESAVGGLG